MEITFSHTTALALLRALRRGELCTRNVQRTDYPPTQIRFGRHDNAVLLEALMRPLGNIASILVAEVTPLEHLVRSTGERSHSPLLRGHLSSATLPPGSFLRLAADIAVPSPELAFVQMAEVLTDAQLLALGMELCGGFACDPLGPSHGPARYGLSPLTTQGRMLWFLSHARGLRLSGRAGRAAVLVSPNAWSPMEAVLATLLLLPADKGGFPIAPLALNACVFQGSTPMAKASRVPDILLEGADVGLNYDGQDHLALSSLETAAMGAACNPGSAERQSVVCRLRAQIRERYVDDRRRDRDLASQGLTVLSVTAEDLRTSDCLEFLLRQIVACLERGTGRREEHARSMLENQSLRVARARALAELRRWPAAPTPCASPT